MTVRHSLLSGIIDVYMDIRQFIARIYTYFWYQLSEILIDKNASNNYLLRT